MLKNYFHVSRAESQGFRVLTETEYKLKTNIRKALKVAFPFVLGGSILYWMYRDFDFSKIKNILFQEMHWEWMFISFIPGILAQVFRGLRWRLALEPLQEKPRIRTCIQAVFLSYAASLVIPRIGEFLRCGILSRYEGTSFPKALGTVVTERAVDTLLMFLLVASVFLLQGHVFIDFFDITGLNIGHLLSKFTQTGIFVTIICIVCIGMLAYLLFRRLAFIHKIKGMMRDLLDGIMSLRIINGKRLYMAYSVGIWVAYFFHYYLTFYCFACTRDLGVMAGLVSFCVGTIAVIVPTPNGAGPWHFAVKTVLVIYGLTAAQAVAYALIVHTIQTFLLVLLGIYAMAVLSLQKDKQKGNLLKDFSKTI